MLTPFGRRIVDLLVVDTRTGEPLLAVECKAGNSPWTPDQRAKDAWLNITGLPTLLFREGDVLPDDLFSLFPDSLTP